MAGRDHDYAWHVAQADAYYANPVNADNYLTDANSYDMTTSIATLSATEHQGVKRFLPDALNAFTEIALTTGGLITTNGDMLTIVRMNSKEEIISLLKARRASRTYYEDGKE